MTLISLGHKTLLATYVARPSNMSWLYRNQIGTAWDYKKVFGWIGHDYAKYLHFPAWQPGLWTSLCVSVSKGKASKKQPLVANAHVQVQEISHTGASQN